MGTASRWGRIRECVRLLAVVRHWRKQVPILRAIRTCPRRREAWLAAERRRSGTRVPPLLALATAAFDLILDAALVEQAADLSSPRVRALPFFPSPVDHNGTLCVVKRQRTRGESIEGVGRRVAGL